MAPLIRRLERFGLYSQTIYNFSIREFPRHNCALFGDCACPAPGLLSGSPSSRRPARAIRSRRSWKRGGARGAEAGGEWPFEMPLGLANSISQSSVRKPIHGGAFNSPSHGFQIFHFDRATLALLKVLLAPLRIRRVQFSVEKRMENKLPFRTGTGPAHPAFGAWRREHRGAHQVVERDRQLAPGLTMTLPFMFG